MTLTAQNGIYSYGSLIASNTLTLLSAGDIYSLGSLQSANLYERGYTFRVSGIFSPGVADIENADHAMEFTTDTDVSGIIGDGTDINIYPNVTLTMTADTSFVAATGAFTMDSTSTIAGGGYNLSISALNASTLGNITNVNLLTLSLISGSTPVTFTSYPSSIFQVNTVQTNYNAILSRSVGTGTSSDPIIIYSDSNAPGGLQYIPISGLGLYYQLANNIDASETSSWNSGAGFVPIGTSGSPFTGNFNGNDYTISNLFILLSSPYTGLFGHTSGAAIENIGLVNVNIMAQNFVGGLVGWNDSSSIANSYVTGSVAGSAVVGGLVAYSTNSSSITNSYATASVTGSNCVGGLVGWNDSSSIANSYATGSELGTYSVGGLVGWNNSSSITTSYATGSVSGSSYVGGLVGSNDSSSIANSYATGSVSGSSYVGGLVGWNQSSSITNSYATGDVSGGGELGGLVGYNSGSSITNSYATGNVSGSSNVGGLIGVDDTTSTLTNNWWYNNLSNGIGNYGPNTSVGQWQEAGGASDFFNPNFAVYIGATPWDFVNTWNSYSSSYPHLQWEHYIPPITGIDISGTVFNGIGGSALGSGITIDLVVNGIMDGSTSTNLSGLYSFPDISAAIGNAILVYISGNTVKGNTVTVSNGSNISNLDIYGGTLTLRNETLGPITNLILATAKGSLTDTDILYSVSSSNLTANTSIYIYSGMTYAPGGDIQVSDALTNDGTLMLIGNEAIDAGTFIDNGTTDYYGTGTYTITPLETYNNLQFDNGTFVLGGTFTANGNFIIDPNVTIEMTGNTSLTAGNAFTMDPTATIDGGNYNLSISAGNNSKLGNINNVNLFTLSSGSGSNVTFVSDSSSVFQVTR